MKIAATTKRPATRSARALHAKSDQELYAVLLDGTVKQSSDGGATWTERVTPPA